MQEGGYGKTASERTKRIAVHTGAYLNLDDTQITGGKPTIYSVKNGWSEDEMVTNRPFTPEMIDPGYIS